MAYSYKAPDPALHRRIRLRAGAFALGVDDDPVKPLTEVSEALRTHPRVSVVSCHPRFAVLGVPCGVVGDLREAKLAVIVVPAGTVCGPACEAQGSTVEVGPLVG